VKRRQLLKTAALGAISGVAPVLGQTTQGGVPPQAPASDRIRVGLIGVGGFGTANMRQFLGHPDVEIVAVCDVSQTNIDKAVKAVGGAARGHKDFRRVLDDKSIDAVMIATPEHWHAYMAIAACDAGKDVYVEKPAGHYIRESRLMLDAARRHNRVMQVGTQQRSGTHFQRVVKYIQEGKIGDVYYATCWNHSPRRTPRPPVTGGPPADLDWDMWLGPAPVTPYEKVMQYGSRGQGWWDFYGGMICEWGAHLSDIVLWAMGSPSPDHVAAAGGLFLGAGEIPDTLQVSYRFPKFVFHYSVLSHNSYGLNGSPGAARFGSYGMQFHGTKGTLFVDRGEFRITPQPVRVEEPVQHPAPSREDMRAPGYYYTTEIQPEQSDSSEQHGPHVRNFLDSVKSRQKPIADIEAGHLANTVCRLGNISYRVGRSLKWDAANERIVDDKEANDLAVGTYREPWKPKGI
jgi:predicted dehydrogenase